MGYYIDLKKISIDQYKKILKTTTLIPSWKVLEENIDENMDRIKSFNIPHLAELKNRLKDKTKVQEFAKQSGLSENYLTVLRRVINGYHPKPNRIKDFPAISEKTVEKLEKVGIKNTLHLYDHILTEESRAGLAQQTGINKKEMLKLTKLCDLSRIKWVNHTFAYVLYEAGYDTAKKVTKADYTELYEEIKALNAARKLYPAHIGLNDMRRLIEGAKMVALEVEY